jgi:uncharacterized integral membrane protein
MRSFLRWLILAPVMIAALLFAFANRHIVTVSFDPFTSNDIQGPQITAPLFIVVILAVMVGALIGGALTWLRQGRHRKAARAADVEMQRLRSESDGLRARLSAAALAAPTERSRIDIP